MICTVSLSGLIKDVQTAQMETELSARYDWLRRTAAALMRSCCVSARVSRFSPHFRQIVTATQDALKWPGEPSICVRQRVVD